VVASGCKMTRRYRVPDTRSLCLRVVVEVLAIFVLVYPMMHIYLFLQVTVQIWKHKSLMRHNVRRSFHYAPVRKVTQVIQISN